MKTTALLLAALALCTALPAHAEEARLPQASPAARAALTVGITDIEIVYHRPGVKGRQIWGGLVPWNEVWRLGANEATTISFSTPVQVEGRDVPAGTYGLFAIPGQDKWTLILNKQPKQWGAYFYKQEEDLLRFDVKPQTGPATEWMAFHMTPSGTDAAMVEMAWDTLRVPFTVKADVQRLVWEELDRLLAGKPDSDTYLSAVVYALQSETRTDQALGWIDKALALEDSFWGHEYKAKLLQRQGKVDEALSHLDKAMELAKGKAPKEYIEGLAKLKSEWKG
jgi:Protein of unknown function (DUF2911)